MKEQLLRAFHKAISETIEGMTGLKPDISAALEGSNTFDGTGEAGVGCIVGFSGKFKGRILLWSPAEMAVKLTEKVVGDPPPNYRDEMVFFTMNEINNVLSGRMITEINNFFDLSLRLTPPSVFAGQSMLLVTPKLKSYQVKVSGLDGKELYLNVAVEGGLLGE